jgi:hypothetical protein
MTEAVGSPEASNCQVVAPLHVVGVRSVEERLDGGFCWRRVEQGGVQSTADAATVAVINRRWRA